MRRGWCRLERCSAQVDLDTPFTIAPDLVSALKKAPGAHAFFEECPLLYRRIRVGYVEAGGAVR